MKLVILIIIIASFLAIKLNKKIEQIIPLTVLGMVLFIYAFGIFDKLNQGIAIIVVISVILLVYLIVKLILEMRKNQAKIMIQNIITPGLLIYISFYMLFYYINKDSIFTHHDEFSHWGLTIKNMYYNQSFGLNENTIIQFNEYPPFTAIFQYILLTLNGQYVESTVIIASNLLYLSLIITIYKNIEWKSNIKMLCIYIPITLFLPMMFYMDFYKNILVDGILGILFFYILYTWYTEKNIIRYMSIILGVSSLSLIKTSGIGLGITILGIVFVDAILNRKKDKKQFIAIVFAILIFIICIISWQIKIADKDKEWSLKKEEIIQTQENVDIVRKYAKSLLSWNIITDKNVTVAIIFMLLIAHLIYQIKQRQKIGKRYIFFSVSLIFSIILYSIILLMTYLFVIPKEESIQIVSFDRYINTIMIAVIMFHTYTFIERRRDLKWSSIIIIGCILIATFPTNTIIRKSFFEKNDRIMELKERESNIKMLEYKNILTSEDKIYYLTNKGENVSKVVKMARYEMLPIKITNSDGVQLNIEKLKEILIQENYTHIYIAKVDDKIKKQLEKNIEEEKMYKIIKTNQQKIQLIEIKKEEG